MNVTNSNIFNLLVSCIQKMIIFKVKVKNLENSQLLDTTGNNQEPKTSYKYYQLKIWYAFPIQILPGWPSSLAGERDEENSFYRRISVQKNFSVEDRAELESHHSATPNKVTDWGNDHQLTKPLG